MKDPKSLLKKKKKVYTYTMLEQTMAGYIFLFCNSLSSNLRESERTAEGAGLTV